MEKNKEEIKQEVKSEAEEAFQQSISEAQPAEATKEEPKKEEKPKKEKQAVKDRNIIEEILTEVKQFNTNFSIFADYLDGNISSIDGKTYAIMPSGVRSESEAIATMLHNDTNAGYKNFKDMTDAERTASFVGNNGYFLPPRHNAFVELTKDYKDKYVNHIEYADKVLTPRTINFKSGKGELSGSMAMNIFRNKISIGEIVQVPLWHSGFWISLKPPTQAEIIQLQDTIAHHEVNIGYETNSFVYSNYSVVLTRILVNFIIEHIAECSFEIPPGEDIREYILINDYYPMLLGLLSTIHPRGINIIQNCKNSLILNEDQKPTCDFVMSALCDPKKMLWVDRSILKDEYINSVMSTRGANQVRRDTILEYQRRISNLVSKDVTVEASNGVPITLTLSVPTISRIITEGERWVSDIVTMTENAFDGKEPKDEKVARINAMIRITVLSIYNSFVTAIYTDKGTENETSTKDPVAILSNLNDMSSDDNLLVNILKEARSYIDSTTIALAGIPNYICPKCSKDQNDHKDKEDKFHGFIPLDLPTYFFDQYVSRLQTKIAERQF